MPQYLPLPDGNSVTIREGETPEQAWARAQEMYPESFGIRPAAKPSTGNGLSDIATAFKQGAVGSTKALTDIFGAENAASTSLDKTAEELQKDYSTSRQAELKAQAARMKKAEQSGSLWEEIKAAAQNVAEAPLQAAAQGVGSFVPYLPTMFVGPIAGALRLAKPTILALEGLAGSAQKLIGTAQGAGAVKGSIYDAVYEKEVQAGVEPEIAKQKAIAAQEYLGKNWEQIALGGAIGRVAAGSGVEKLLTKQGAEAAADKVGRRVGQAVLQEGLTEAPQGGQERLAANLALQREGYDTPLFQGVAGAATQEGLTGGLSAAPIAAIRGPKAAAQPVQQDELQRLRDEEEKRLAEERQFKETPDYAQQVVQQYDELAKQKQALVAQIKKIDKESPTADADRAFNRDINAQIKELEKQIKPLAEDYHVSKGKLKEIERQAALAKMPVEDFMLQQMGMEVKPVKPKEEAEPVVRRGKGQLFGVEETPPVEDTALQDYAQGQFEAARGAGVFDLGDTADYMMQDPTKAAEMVKTRTPIPGLSDKDSNTVLSGIKMRLAAIEKGERAASKQELAQRQEVLKQQTLTQPADQMAMFKESQEDVEEQRRTAEPNFDYLDPMFEKALDREPVIKVSEKVKPIARGPQIQKQLDALIDEVDRADQDYRTARYATPAQGKRGAPERAAAMEALTKGKVALEKIEQLSKEGGEYAREVVAARRQQQEAMAQLSDVTEQLRRGETLGGENRVVAASTEQTLTNKAEQIRGQLISSALQEAALHRRAAGNPAITQEEAIKAASVMFDAVNDWVQRSKVQMPRAELTNAQKNLQPTRQRVNKNKETVSTYTLYDEEAKGPVELTIIRHSDGTVFRVFSSYPDGGRVEYDNKYGKGMTDKDIIQKSFLNTEMFTLGREIAPDQQRISPAEIKHFQERIKSAMRNLLEKPEVKATRIETGPLKRQFKETEAQKVAEARGETATTLRGELSRRTEFVRNKMAKMGAMRPGARDALNAAADLMDEGKATRDILDKVEPVVDAIVAGRDVKQVDIQAIKDAIRATEEVPQGQKALFPEVQEDLGYIRATPKNFANSPRMRPVWEALANARELASKAAQARATRVAERDAAIEQIRKLRMQIDNLKKDTKFFWAAADKEGGGGLYSMEALAKVFARMPEAGNTTEEKVLLERYAKGEKLNEQDEITASRLLNAFRVKELPAYKARLDEALGLLAQGQRLEDTDNQLLAFMQDTNTQVKTSAKELSNALKPLRDAIENIKEVLFDSAVLTPEQRALIKAEKNINKQRNKYSGVVEKAVKKARKEMDRALGALLDPIIVKSNKDLKAAEDALVKEQAELDKIKKRFDSVLAQEDGANRTELATYELFRYEEKKGIIDDLKKQVEELTTTLNELVEERSLEYDGGYAVAQAMLDGKVKFERQYLEMLEANLAAMRGESVLDRQSAYPFAYQQAKKHFDAQQQLVKAAEKRATEFKEQAKTDQQKLEDIWKTKFGGEGIKREDGKVERIQTTAEKEAEKLRKQAIEALDKQEAAAEKEAIKEQILKTYADQLGDLLLEVEAIPGPNTEAELKKIINDPKSELEDVINAQAKVSVLRAIASVEAQEEVFLEGKPARKQKAATTLSSIGQAKGKPLRTGRMTDAKLEKLFKPTAKERALSSVYFEDADQGGLGINQYGEGKTQGSFDFGGDFNFSRGESTTGTDAKTLKDELDEAMGTDVTARGNVKIYNSVEAFIKENPKYAEKIPSDAKGFAEKGRAILFANNIGKGHGLGVLLHEIGVHVGFRNFFNETQFNRLADTVKNWATRTDNSIEAQIGRKAMQRVEMAETPADQVNDELLAYAVEEAVQAGVLGTKKGSAYGWLSSIIDAFKKALNKLGIPTSEITAGDLVNFAHGCAQLELRGTWHGTGGMFDAFDFSFMGTGEGFQAFSWGTYRAQRSGVARHYREIGKENQKKVWNKLPEIAAWRKTQEPNFNGFFADDYLEFAQNPKLEGTKLGGIPHEYAMDFSMLLSFMDPNTDDFMFHDMSRDSPFERLNNAIARFEHGMDEGLLPLNDDVKQFVQNMDISKLNIPFSAPVFRGMDWFDTRSQFRKGVEDLELKAAEKILWQLRKNDSDDSFAKKLDDAIAAAKTEEESTLWIFEDQTNSPSYKEAQSVLEGLKQINKKDFVFNPITPPPLPEPTGVMMRTLHTRPEDTYLLWDSPLSKQPAPVNEAFKNIIRDMRANVAKQFNSLVNADGATGASFYQSLKFMTGDGRLATEILASYGVSGTKFLDHDSRGRPITQKSTYNYVDYVDKEEGAEIIATNIEPIGKAKGILLSRKPQFNNAAFEKVSTTVTKTVAQNRSWWDKVKANTTGLAFETQLVDRFAGFERLAKYMDNLKGTQMLYYLRTYDQRMNIVSKAVADGAPVIKEFTRKDGRVERLVETSGGANIASIVNKLREAQPYIGNGEAVNQVFTTYMAAIRAKNKGIETLNFGTDKDGKPVLTQAMLDEVTALVNSNKELKSIFEAARKEYNQYNRDMLDFVASTGALSKELVKRLVAQDDYIPFYRERKGVVELVIGNESPVRIGSIADQPYLQELVGGDTAILDFMTSSVQNTNMLVDMGMRNLATKNAVMELVDLKAATLVKKADGKDVVKFKVDGDDRYAIIATEKVTIGSKEFETGVPADILVKGMEGIPTQMPFLLRAMAMPAQVLRKAITLSPVYMARQLFRDSLAAPILSGADFMPIIGAVKEINSATKQTLEKRGITGGQQFKGTSEDLSMILREISDGKPGWMKALGALEATSMELDAATRRAQYNSYIEQGLSEMEATLMALESMNFNKRGASPSIHVANALIPFFNAQIQGLNVMYKAMAGKMPFNDQLRIREKMLMRGGMMAGATILYAMMMQDDEAYKNATPDQKYGNWFIRVPGLDEPLKFPIPFEIGYIFKAIPEALYNSMTQKHGGEEAVQAFNQILIQTLPGGSSMPTIDVGGGLKIPTLIPLPQAVKPVIETALEKSFYTGRDILSEREKKLLPEQQFRNNTSEAAKLVGSTFGLSPIKMEALVSGYTGTMGLAFLHAISLGVPAKETPEQAVKRLSEYPIVGGVFQPNDAGGIINSVYMRLNEDERVRSTVRTLFNEGKAQEAQALLTKRGAEYMEAELGDKFKANMNKLTQAERAIAASNLSAEAKRAQLDDIRKMKIALANMTREISDKTIRLSGFS